MTQSNSIIHPYDSNHCWWSDEVLSSADSESSPWYKDFVLISEFSELEGPLPLAIVSHSTYIDLKHYTDNPASIVDALRPMGLESFDFNAFVLRVVSVDRSSEYEHIDPEFLLKDAPCSFSIPDDTQVYFTDSEHHFFAFTHHLTLFDINARGYVHPVALSYITRDPHKIVIRFEELMEQFNEVSIKMKKGNYSNFTLDLKRRLLDLHYTESASDQRTTLSKQAIQQAITATKLMIDTLESSLSQPIQDQPKDYTPQCIDSLYPVPHFEKKLRSLAQLCQEPKEDKKPTHTVIPLVFSIIESQHQQNTRPTFANAMQHDMYSEAIDSMQDMIRHMGKSSVILDVNEEEQSFIQPKASAMTFGRTFMLNMDNPQPREDDETLDEKIASHTIAPSEDDAFYPITLAATQLWTSTNHLLEVLKHYQSLIVDVIFSLLTGRTVWIQGSAHNKDHVKKIVGALSVFVPGQRKDRHQIIDWFESKLTDADIGSMKLVGIDKDKMDASIHLEGSCVLDIDVQKGSLNSSPVYVEGQWINQLLDRIMLFSSDASYLAYLHTVFMTMSLKAFIYHHLYVCDEFKLDDLSTSTSNGYASETNSESSTLSRKWSVRLMSYLKKQEDGDSKQTEEEDSLSRTSSKQTDQLSRTSSKHTVTEDEEDYSEENQATVTLQNITKPGTIVGLFGNQSTRHSSDTSSDEYDMTTHGSFLNFGAEDVDYFGQQSSSEEEEEKPTHRKHHRKLSDVGPDGVSYTERRGRRYLQDKLKVYGDDQTIVVYLATCVL